MNAACDAPVQDKKVEAHGKDSSEIATRTAEAESTIPLIGVGISTTEAKLAAELEKLPSAIISSEQLHAVRQT